MRFSFICCQRWTISSLPPATHQYCFTLTLSIAFPVFVFALAGLLTWRASSSSPVHSLIIPTPFCARHVRTVACVWTKAHNRHLVISLFHTSVLISMDGINYHGDERRGDPAHVYACHAITEAPLSCREASLRTLCLPETARAGDKRVCIDFFLTCISSQ